MDHALVNYIDPPAIDRIASVADPVVRNLQITQSYHELSAEVGRRTREGANWCTFATWASKQAGQTIRQEDLVRCFERVLRTPPQVSGFVETVGRWLLRSGWLQARIYDPVHAFRKTSDAVARGNRKVFEEIAREFARFLPLCEDPSPDPARLDAFCEALKPGDPPDGQRYLRQAFSRYYQALFVSDPVARAQLLLLANLEIGFHEQTRLQPEIEESLDVPSQPVGFFLRILGMGFAARLAQTLTRHAITECLMTLRLPGGEVLSLGGNMPGRWPESLQRITNSELDALMARFEPSAGHPDDSGAWDWAKLRDRMHFIVHLFRSRHERGDLFGPPFSDVQVSALKSGRVPAGSL